MCTVMNFRSWIGVAELSVGRTFVQVKSDVPACSLDLVSRLLRSLSARHHMRLKALNPTVQGIHSFQPKKVQATSC